MHCELIVPGLFAEASGTRAPALELLLARGRSAIHAGSDSLQVEAWLQAAFAVEGQSLPAGALSLAGVGREPGVDCWARADPVHLRVLRDRLIVVPPEAFALSRPQADALVETLNRHFGERLMLEALEAGRWCARLDPQLAFHAAPPLEAAGRDVDLAMRGLGEAGKRWAALLNEAQMLLHEHPVNAEREARGEPALNSIWLWGGGVIDAAKARPFSAVIAADPLARGLALAAGIPAHALPKDADSVLAALGDEGRVLVVLDAPREAQLGERRTALERDWFLPLFAALKSGRIGMLTLHLGGAESLLEVETVRSDLRYFWRLRKPLSAYA